MATHSPLRALVPQPLRTWWYRRFVKRRSPFTPEVVAARAIFIHVPKTAGTSIKRELYGAPKFGHIPVSAFHAHDPARTAAFFKFCFVRDPWDRLASAWSFLTQGDGASATDRHFADRHLARHRDFAAFVAALEDPELGPPILRYAHFRPQAYWLCLGPTGGHAMDFVGRYERLAEDMGAIRRRLGLPDAPLAHSRPSRRLDHADAWGPGGRDVVARVYARDLALFGYGGGALAGGAGRG